MIVDFPLELKLIYIELNQQIEEHIIQTRIFKIN